MDLKLTTNPDGSLGDDMEILNGELSWVTGKAAIAQHLAMRFRTWLGETVYDQTAGVPWKQVIFQRGTDLTSVKFILEQIALATPGVTAADLTPELNRTTRDMSVEGTVETVDGNIDFSEIIEATP